MVFILKNCYTINRLVYDNFKNFMIVEFTFLLYLYFIFLFIWFLFFTTAIFHMLKYGFKNTVTIFSTVVFILISLAILATSFYFINEINWKAEFELF